LEAHGGYLCRLQTFGSVDVVALAREAALADGLDPEGTALQVSCFLRSRVVRLAYDNPRVYGRKASDFYAEHHALAQCLSIAVKEPVHAYRVDPEELEEVVAYADGRRVGGERLIYDDAEVGDGELSENGFDALKDRWPIGHLARVLGLRRVELLGLPRSPSLLLELGDGRQAPPLDDVWTVTQQRGQAPAFVKTKAARRPVR
jgi:hypothetical protein